MLDLSETSIENQFIEKIIKLKTNQSKNNILFFILKKKKKITKYFFKIFKIQNHYIHYGYQIVYLCMIKALIVCLEYLIH